MTIFAVTWQRPLRLSVPVKYRFQVLTTGNSSMTNTTNLQSQDAFHSCPPMVGAQRERKPKLTISIVKLSRLGQSAFRLFRRRWLDTIEGIIVAFLLDKHVTIAAAAYDDRYKSFRERRGFCLFFLFGKSFWSFVPVTVLIVFESRFSIWFKVNKTKANADWKLSWCFRN